MDTQKAFSGMRKTIAQRMRMSLDTAAQASHHTRVDMTALLAARKAYNAAHPDASLSVTDSPRMMRAATGDVSAATNARCLMFLRFGFADLLCLPSATYAKPFSVRSTKNRSPLS